MVDKNGIEIVDKCYLRIKYKYGDEEQLQDAIYLVSLNLYSGIELNMVHINYPESSFHTSIKWDRREIREDYVNGNYDRLAIVDTWGENTMHRQKWKEQHYSNDIEVVDYKTV